jgi:hypothetical protein
MDESEVAWVKERVNKFLSRLMVVNKSTVRKAMRVGKGQFVAPLA